MKLKSRFCFYLASVSLFFSFHVFAQNIWIQKANFPGAARLGATGFVIGDNIYVTCGYDGANFLNDLWEYNTISDSWTQKASLPATARYAASGFAAGLKGYVCCGSITPQLLSDLWQYDPQTDSWTQKANFPGGARHFSSVFVLYNNAYFGTGALSSAPVEDMWMYDSVDDTWTQMANFAGGARAGAYGITIGDTAYVGGGVAGTINPVYLNDFWRYDPFNDSWLQVADFGIVGKSGPAAFVSGDRPTVGAGGAANSSFTSDMWQYNSATDMWDSVASFGGGDRSYAVAFGVNGKGYMGLGSDGSLHNDWWEFIPPITGISEAKSGKLTVYPNPASDQLTIVDDLNTAPFEIKIMDLSGRLKMEFKTCDSPTTISVKNLEAGIYILKATAGNKILFHKIMISE